MSGEENEVKVRMILLFADKIEAGYIRIEDVHKPMICEVGRSVIKVGNAAGTNGPHTVHGECCLANHALRNTTASLGHGFRVKA